MSDALPDPRSGGRLALALACSIAVACAPEEAASGRRAMRPQPPPSGNVIATRVPMPGPYRGRLAAAVAANADCISCHDDQAVEWRGSRHQQANTNSAYTHAFAIEPTAFCRGCHAPEADPAKD